MATFPTFPSIDLSRVELPSFDRSRLPELPEIDLSRFQLPTFDRSRLPELPALDTAQVAERVGELARDTFYVGVGLGVLAVQQAQVRRRELQARVEHQVRQLAGAG